MDITIHLEAEQARKLEYIQQQTNQDAASVINRPIAEAIDLCYQNLQPSPYEILMQNGFIGCGSGNPDLSTNYKTLLQQDLELKYDHS